MRRSTAARMLTLVRSYGQRRSTLGWGVACLASVIALAMAGAASAGSYTFRVDHVDGHPHVTWTQPASYPNVYIDWIEVATAPTVASDGHFFAENVVDQEIYFSPTESTGEWLSAHKLEPGTYYVHLRALRQSDYATAWSSIATLSIPEPPPPPEPRRKPWIKSFSAGIARTDAVSFRPWWRFRITVCARNWPDPVYLTVLDHYWQTGRRGSTVRFRVRGPDWYGSHRRLPDDDCPAPRHLPMARWLDICD